MIKDYWLKDGEDEYKLKPLTNQDIAKAEEKLGVKFPKSYIELLHVQNGGYIPFNAYRLDEDEVMLIDHIMGIGMENGVMESDYYIQEWDLPKDIVLLSGDGHSWFALDYRKVKEEPPVIYIDLEEERILEIAPNFEAFLNGLIMHEEDEEEDVYVEYEERHWTKQELEETLASENEHEIMMAVDFLFENMDGNESFLVNNLIKLLQSPNLELKQFAANYLFHADEMNILSDEIIQKIVAIMKKDHEIDYYVDMFFADRI